jgi:hypothetical protein
VQSPEAFLEPPVVQAYAAQVREVFLTPSSGGLRDLDAKEPKLGFDPVLCPDPVTDELPASSDHLPVAAFVLTRYPDFLQETLGQKVGQLPAVPLSVLT